MKKLIYVGAFLFLGTIALSSCKKDRKCICQNGNDYVIENQTKNKAKKTCEGKVGVGAINVSTSNCHLE